MVPLLLFLLPLLTLFILAIYRLTYHPLSHNPGPRLWSISRLPYAYNLFRGILPYRIAEIHTKYGPVVRLAPSEVSFITTEAWPAIYSYRDYEGRITQMGKDPTMIFRPKEGRKDMIFEEDDEQHSRMRRIFSHAFSNRSLRDQEPVIKQYADLMISRLHEIRDKPVDISAWFNYVTFDVAADFVLGGSFGCLQTGTLRRTRRYSERALTLLGISQRFWLLTPILMYLMPKRTREGEAEHRVSVKERLALRLEQAADARNDIFSRLAEFLNTPNGLTSDELFHTISVFAIAGSKTVATALSGLVYYLLLNPRCLATLQSEVRNAFTDPSEMNTARLQSLPYLSACIHEILRIFPPVTGSLRRITPRKGCVIAGIYVPGNTSVAVDLLAASLSPLNFHCPETFIPERWLDASDFPTTRSADFPYRFSYFQDDQKTASQPFSYGPRNCIGRKMAWVEMRALAARLMWEFEFELCGGSRGWGERMEVYTLYERPPLMVRLSPVDR